MNELGADAAIRRMQEARHVLEHPMVVEAIMAMRANQYANLEATKPSQSAEREFIYHQLKAIESFEAQFGFHIEEGKLALSWLEQHRAKKAAKNRRG